MQSVLVEPPSDVRFRNTFDFVSTKAPQLSGREGGNVPLIPNTRSAVPAALIGLFWLYDVPPALCRSNNTRSRLLKPSVLHIWHEALSSSLLGFFFFFFLPSSKSEGIQLVAAGRRFSSRAACISVTSSIYFHKSSVRCVKFLHRY